MIRVLCVTDFFVPGFKGGGVIRTLENMRHQLSGKVSLAIFTRDRDLGSKTPYPNIKIDQWNDTADGPIYYASPESFGPSGLAKAMQATAFDAVYLNSFFSPNGSIKICRALLGIAPKTPVLLAPRGEFSDGALAEKKSKKRFFLTLARLLGLYRNVYWQASTNFEAQDIMGQFPGTHHRLFIAPDPVVTIPQTETPSLPIKTVGQVSLVFISRISPMKNLDGLLRVLRNVRTTTLLNIYGPAEDAAHWRECEALIASLPDHITVNSHGAILPKDVSATFAKHDLFTFPTHGENFGHVIFESLRAGTPVLLSDQTPWQPDATGSVTVVPASNEDQWRDAIEEAAYRDQATQDKLRQATHKYAASYAETDPSLSANLEMFQAILLNEQAKGDRQTAR